MTVETNEQTRNEEEEEEEEWVQLSQRNRKCKLNHSGVRGDQFVT